MWSKSHHNELIKSNGFKVQLTRLSLYMVNFIRPSDWSAEKKKFTAVPVFPHLSGTIIIEPDNVFSALLVNVWTQSIVLFILYISIGCEYFWWEDLKQCPKNCTITDWDKVTESKTVQMTIRQIQIWQTLYTLIYKSVYVYKALNRIKNTRHFLKCQVLCIDTQPVNWILNLYKALKMVNDTNNWNYKILGTTSPLGMYIYIYCQYLTNCIKSIFL